MTVRATILLMLAAAVSGANAELQSVTDEDLSEITGQNGIYLSGDITINENGGPLLNEHWGDCSDSSKRCGGRVTAQPRENGGWLVLDDIRGAFSFQGLTLRSRKISEGFGGDGAEFDNEVLEIGLPDVVQMREVSFAFGTSSTARPTDPGFRQTDFFNFQIHGDVVMQGNLLVFPSGTP